MVKLEFGEMHKYLKTTRMNKVEFASPKSLNFRSKSLERLEYKKPLNYGFIDSDNVAFLKNLK